MTNLDEQKVKDLLLKVVSYVDRMASPNSYRWTLTDSIRREIQSANLLTAEAKPDSFEERVGNFLNDV